jgi:ABC-type uncharacterized transport system substrate-binding protein
MSTDLFGCKVDSIATRGASSISVSKGATSTSPIVFSSGFDLVGDDLVAGLARRGGNVAGFS